MQPSYEPAVVERYRFEARVHGEQQVETTVAGMTSTLAHVQQFAVAATTESAADTLVGRADVEWHVMREDSVVEQATAKEITHHDVEVNHHLTRPDPVHSLSSISSRSAAFCLNRSRVQNHRLIKYSI